LIEDLRTRFLPRFLESSRNRLARARALYESADAKALAAELHALAGEAMMLDLGTVADNARRGETAARDWSVSTGSTDASRATCASCLDLVGDAVAALVRNREPASAGNPARGDA
jgi:HPt (histidine-containing phosphotransfer) domain-containing protein